MVSLVGVTVKPQLVGVIVGTFADVDNLYRVELFLPASCGVGDQLLALQACTTGPITHDKPQHFSTVFVFYRKLAHACLATFTRLDIGEDLASTVREILTLIPQSEMGLIQFYSGIWNANLREERPILLLNILLAIVLQVI